MTQPYPRPEVDQATQTNIGKMMVQIASTKGRRDIAIILTALGVENARLLAEVNEHRQARGFELLKEHKPKL